MKPPLPPPQTDALTSSGLLAYLEDGWRLNDLLFDALVDDEAFALQPDPLRNPLIFYFGHCAAFFVNKLVMAGLMDGGIDPHLDVLFARGVDPHASGELDVDHGWPSVSVAREYRAEAKARVIAFITSHTWEGRTVGWDDPEWALLMAMEHQRIHFETSSMLVRQVKLPHLRRPESWRYAPTVVTAPAPGGTIRVAGASVTLGRPPGIPLYGWDNEFGQQVEVVGDFEGHRNLITNAQFLEFVRNGGYERTELWPQAARPWLMALTRRHPLFWRSGDDSDEGFTYRAMFDELPLPMSWPVEVCGFEAQAFCRWSEQGWRLPTEAEHALMALGSTDEAGAPRATGADERAPNLDLAWGSPTPVGWCTGATSASGFRDMRGNVWEWLSDNYRPFEGFAPHPYYEDYSNLYFDEHHALMSGGAWASTGQSASKWYRNWFRRHFYQHAGLRMVRSV